MAKNLKSGEKVIMINCGEAEHYEGKVWVTRSEPWMLCGSEVILIKGFSGGFATDCLARVEVDS
jgi:hypothetical protein